MKFISEDIEIRNIKYGESYFQLIEKIFAGASFPYNPTKILCHFYKGNTPIKGVKNLKDPNWGIIYLQRKEELGDILEVIKESYIIAKNDYGQAGRIRICGFL